ncbi:MAG TPA: zinc dependent phospholipase C family protein [bacterium]|nr:zinc dependent phospholipase C family protein [bacterium]
MHVDLATSVLAKAALVAPVIRGLIKRFPDSFIYGAASPDIIVGKKYAGYLYHCHNWRIGWLILNEAESDRQRAAAYGYLTHLAADAVAHNYYIPVKIVRSFEARLLSHTYWEMRFDLGVPERAWARMEAIGRRDVEEFDRLLNRVLRKTLFSFSTNKRIFNTILNLQRMKRIRRSLAFYARHSRFDMVEENRRHYHELAHEAAFDFLRSPDEAEVLSVDPAGLARLSYAGTLRRNIRAMLRRGMLSKKEASKFVDLVEERLAVGLYRPEMSLPDIDEII